MPDGTNQGLHSELGASGMYRWSRCPGSVGLIRAMPKGSGRRSQYAARGTVAHRVIENEIRYAIQHARALRITQVNEGDRIEQDGHEIEIDQDFLHGVMVMLNYVEKQRRNYAFMRVETQVSLQEYMMLAGVDTPVPLFATADVILVSFTSGVLEVIDYKNGVQRVTVPWNPQLLYYAAGVLMFLHPDDRLKIKRIRITVVQPHAGLAQPVNSWDITVVDLLMWVDDTLIPAVERCNADDAPFVSGTWCRFCPAAQRCPKLIEDAQAMARSEFGDHFLPGTPEELAKDLEIAERAEMWISALRAHATEQLKAQVRIPGWGLEPTRATRRWIDETQAGSVLTHLAGVAPEVIHKTELLSPAQMEKALRGKGRQWWQTTVAPLIEHHSSGEKLARVRDAPGDEFVLADEDDG